MDRGDVTDETLLRLIRIVNLLRTAPDGMTLAELAERCGVPAALVREDLIRLSEYCRAPLVSSLDAPDAHEDSSPEEEVWSLASTYFSFPITSLSRGEALTLLRILRRADGESAAASARKKVERSLDLTKSPAEVDRALGRRVVKTGRTMYGSGQEESRLDALEKFASDGTALSIIYEDTRGRRTERDTCPAALVYDWRTCAWYLYGYNPRDGGFRHFRVDRIRRFWPSSKSLPAPDSAEVDRHVRSCWGVECTGPPVAVAVRFANDFNVIERMRADTADRQSATYEECADGSVIYRDIMPGYNEFRTWVLSFGESAEVLAPKELRDSVAASVARVLERYRIRVE
ncbi:MAG: WYL domain-containing protein [Firmicutes bacterium]|nr:WYL domain-containing protein [Bacillota bacterium]